MNNIGQLMNKFWFIYRIATLYNEFSHSSKHCEWIDNQPLDNCMKGVSE